MNVSECKSRVKRQFGDESGVQITDDDILVWINDGQRDVVMQNTGVLDAIHLENLVAYQDEYDMPEDVMFARSLRIKTNSSEPYEHIPSYDLTKFSLNVSTWDGNQGTGRPEFYTIYNGKIFLYPKPSTSLTDGIKLLYSKKPVDVSEDSDPLGLPIMFHNAIVDYCLSKAYELDEDWESHGVKAAQYQNQINTQVNRETLAATETYPTITVRPEDL